VVLGWFGSPGSSNGHCQLPWVPQAIEPVVEG